MKIIFRKWRLGKTVKGFTLIELLVVMTIIGILAAMVLNLAGFARTKAARSRATSEIAAISSALEAYKIDNGEYPNDSTTQGSFSVTGDGATASYKVASSLLYRSLSGGTGTRVYFPKKDDMLIDVTVSPGETSKAYADPFGNSYGYATPNTTGTNTYNPTFDLWSTGGKASGSVRAQWIANFPVE